MGQKGIEVTTIPGVNLLVVEGLSAGHAHR